MADSSKKDEPVIVCLADDQTGANATAALLRDAGLASVVLTSEGRPVPDRFDGQALVVNVETRDIESEPGAARVTRVVEEIRAEQNVRPVLWNKRVDSTLRGHILPELAAMRRALPGKPLLLAPAFPAAGRVTVEGRQLLDVPGSQGKARELGSLPSLLRKLGIAALQEVTAENAAETLGGIEAAALADGALIADARTDSDLAVIARASLQLWLNGAIVVDSGPFVAHLARAALGRGLFPPSRDGPVLLILGTQSSVTERQLALLRAAHPATVLLDPSLDSDIEGADVIALTSRGNADSAEEGLTALTERTVAVLARLPRPYALIVSGGLTCSHVLARLQADAIEVRGEMLPLIPFGILRGGVADGAFLATKGGLSGQDDSLLQAVKLLRLLRRQA